ncbi:MULTISPECIES: AMP-binding protein [Methanobacterium]|uniref:AMP-binding protein n=1 Tax=Methanobacterium veterum TaxID=408577 RepID=A0A9E5DLW1_9EURY|nr:MULTISPECIES: AMP-binding protein [Methanobacterium]MCZ3366070.1 AMP-binding protein [Methanobacterium veterum]MCZ3371702.1 AMP-binding protein [Methanobacterium veterum]
MESENMNKVVLLTGANGFLGTQVALRLLRSYNYKIIALIRGNDKQHATNRLSRAWWEFPELLDELGNRIHVLNGDITRTELGIENQEYKNLIQTVTHIIHTAADWKLKSSLEELQKINVHGTENMLKLAQLAHEDHGLERFSHVSTAYVAGGKKGVVSEDSLTSKYGFLSDYEKTKFESEVLVRKSGFEVSIFRPSMIVGDSSTGYIKTFNTVYVPLRLYLSGKLKIIPVSRSMKINLVPVDYVADSIVKLTFDREAVNKTFHLTAPVESLPTLEELIEFVRKWSDENMDIKISTPIYMPLNTSLLQKISSNAYLFGKGTGKLLETVNTLSPYFNENREYLRDNAGEIMGPYRYKWQNFLPKLLEFAVYHGFLHRSDRTVHEQVLFRLQRNSRPVKYYDIVKGEIKESSATDIYQNIISASKALQSMGVNKGDKVAVAGYNSTKYLILDIAIGIIGAVSVPIYYTSPLNEIKEILDDSSAKILFAGTPQILDDLKEFDAHISVIALCRQSINNSSQIVSWEEFLKKGETINKMIDVPLNFDDTATIRYTSGTTGKPRGVMFTHGNLRWMAEFIASMPLWKNRTGEISYLSFLPMNHVVEGIMGTYAPYYAPASLNLYFLENFHDLEESLQKVRPNVFFSVPRFYEKVWCNVLESKIGQIYLNSSGILKTVLGKLIRREILKRAGLDRCAQLIVGSAPVSDELLKYYHELGIEVHNAYGLTEAPLITINRVGKNRIGTVGKPLPDTYIKIDGDGEILINGPQVMSGYFKDDSDSLEDGWLHTGDLGYETPEDSLVITGRRKEVLVNSYGKTISPLKIEVMLKNISGIEEAMVIGDGKPYCSAFLWAESNLEGIDEAISEINTQLSRPEEIKKWVVLNNDLSIGTDLTANLKLKRKSISKRYEDIINFIYGSGTKPDSILHFGSIGVDL